jgi:hypothetical protein
MANISDYAVQLLMGKFPTASKLLADALQLRHDSEFGVMQTTFEVGVFCRRSKTDSDSWTVYANSEKYPSVKVEHDFDDSDLSIPAQAWATYVQWFVTNVFEDMPVIPVTRDADD